MAGERLTQFGRAEHGRILVIAVQQRIGRGVAHIVRPAIIGKTLTEIDGLMLERQLRHHLENGGGHVAEQRIADLGEHDERVTCWR
jgi:hypothetical protein